MKKISLLIAALSITAMLTACGSTTPVETREETLPLETLAEALPPETEAETQPTETASLYVADFDQLQALLGMQDADTADLLGGGQENWTEDKSFYIGRNFQIQLKDRIVLAHTTCDEDQVVNSVSVWLSDGETSVTKDEADAWVAYLTEYTGVEPAFDDTTSEAGSQNWTWVTEDTVFSLNWLDTVFSFSMNPKVGELH